MGAEYLHPACYFEVTSVEYKFANERNQTCVKDVASLTEKGTSRTLAKVLASSVFPVPYFRISET